MEERSHKYDFSLFVFVNEIREMSKIARFEQSFVGNEKLLYKKRVIM